MASQAGIRWISANLVVVVLTAAAFLAAFSVLTAPGVSADPGDLIVSGRVTDNSTSLPIPNAMVHIEGNTVPYVNETMTNATGDYAMSLPAGDYLFAVAHGSYYMHLEMSVTITGNLTKDVALDQAPPRDATVKGYVTDNATGLPITTGRMLAFTPSAAMPVYLNLSSLDASGYYEIDIFPADYRVESEVDGYLMNTTTFAVVSGDTYWANMSLDPLPPETSVIQGYVWEEGTGQPIVGALAYVDFGTSFNSTVTNGTGYYVMNVSAGDPVLRVSASGFAAEERPLSIADNETLWENFTLVPTNSTVKGYITDEGTGVGIDGASAFVSEMGEPPLNFTLTNSTGYYEMGTIAGSLMLGAMKTGYLWNMTAFSIADAETRWIDLTLRFEDAVLKGYVDEFGTGAPLGGVNVDLGIPPFSGNATVSDGSGYYEIGFVSGLTEMTASLPGYQFFASDLDLAPGENWFNFTMYPELLDNATLQGYVNDTGGPIPGALLRAEGYGTWSNETFTDGTGFYAMNVVPADQTLFARASGHAPNWTTFSIADGETLWLNVTLAIDSAPPNVTALDAAPATNVSTYNPTTVTGTVNEAWLDQAALSVLALRNASAGVRNFTLLATFPETDYNLVESSPGSWDLDYVWDAQIPAGWMGNTSGREWVPLFLGFTGPWDLVMGEYRNASSPTPTMAIAFFSQTAGELELLSIGGPPMPPPADPTGEFRAVSLVVTLDDFDNMIAMDQLNGTWFSVLDVDFLRDDLVSSGTYGFWLQTWDYGDSYGQKWTFLDVDNTPPVADAGPDQAVLRTTTVVFDGTGSTDNVGIVNHTWTFDDGGTVTLYGMAPSHTFNASGNFEVTLSVTDGAMNVATDILWVNVTLDAEPPVADAGPDQMVDEGSVVAFNGSASTDNMDIANYTWTFTDAAPQTLWGVGPAYLFANPGTYIVTLTVTDLDANIDTDNVTITVIDVTPPTADAGPDGTVDEDAVVTLNGSASTDNVGIVNYTWTFDDGGPMTLYGVAPTHTFAQPGSYVITLTVLDAAGNPDNDTVTITALDITPPIADAGPDQTVDAGTVVTFDGSASTDNVGIVNYTWDFGDGTFGYGATPTHAFADEDVYTVTLTARDAAGNEDTDSLAMTQLGEPLGSVTGRVRDAETAEFIEGAVVKVYDQDGIERGSDTTSASGAFSIVDLPLGVYDIVITAQGYENATIVGQELTATEVDLGTVDLTPSGGPIDTGGLPDWWWIILVAIAAIAAVLLLLAARRKPAGEVVDEDEGTSEAEELPEENAVEDSASEEEL